MALKPNTIKALFGNLNMDTLNPVLKSQILQDTADDTARLLKYMDSQAKYGPYPYHRYQSNPAVRNALQAATGYVGGIPVIKSPTGGIMNDAAEFVFANDVPYSDVDTYALSSALSNAADAAPEIPYKNAVSVGYYDDPLSRVFPTGVDGLVPHYDGRLILDDAHEPVEELTSYRPHRNNKQLAKWYSDIVKRYNKGLEMSKWNVPETVQDLNVDILNELPF